MKAAYRRHLDSLKAELDALRPLKLEHESALTDSFKIGLTYTSNALEGNSLTETETKIVILPLHRLFYRRIDEERAGRYRTVPVFITGNGRTARLLMNVALLQEGYPVVIIPPILRREYIDTLESCHGMKGNPEPFFDFIARAAIESLRDYLRLLRSA